MIEPIILSAAEALLVDLPEIIAAAKGGTATVEQLATLRGAAQLAHDRLTAALAKALEGSQPQ